MARGKSETLKLVFSRGVRDRILGDNRFAEFVWKSALRFERGDWGDVTEDDWISNDIVLKSLQDGGWYGRVLASYMPPVSMAPSSKIRINSISKTVRN